MILEEVMDEIAGRLKTVAAFKSVFEWPVGSVPSSGIPAAIVDYPENYDPHATYARGAEEITGLPVIVVAGAASDRAARGVLSQFVTGPGASDVIAVLEARGYKALDDLTVVGVDFGRWRIGEIDHAAAIFRCDIIGQGS